MMKTNLINEAKAKESALKISKMFASPRRDPGALYFMGVGSEYFKQKHLPDDVFIQEFENRPLRQGVFEDMVAHSLIGKDDEVRAKVLMGKWIWLTDHQEVEIPPMVRFYMAEGSEVLGKPYLLQREKAWLSRMDSDKSEVLSD
ncbi:hypothetical protein PsorP6_014058 [Peronosclerospora sorghi]|uniref:Uncharacterized protein n=1 Tax=Peronosclerospora sorghi TaxID=230839 RepID=A0ACC0VHC7_9STRA|nr:hypothetical protein PsorP6_014058 [Peronosclerospora sorghi]